MTSTSQINPSDMHGYDGNYWDHARREYLSGVTAAAICQRYGMSMSSFRLHARAGGWRRMDRTDCDVAPEPGEYHPDDPVGFADLADEAFLNIRRALGTGRAAEASTWLRVYDKLADRARPQVMADLPDAAPPVVESSCGPLRLVAVETFEPMENNAMDVTVNLTQKELHVLDSVFPESNPPAAAGSAPGLQPSNPP